MVKKLYKIIIFPYAIVLLYLMLLGFGRTPYDDHIIRLKPIFSTFGFIEKSFLWNNTDSLLINIFGNILLFIPFGFLGWVGIELNSYKKLLFSFLSVLISIEFLQYITKMGVFDIDDLLLNTLGMSIGYMLYKRC